MTLWEFSNSDFTFKESCIKPIPSMMILYRHLESDVLATSSYKYLIIAYKGHSNIINQLIYNGRDWKLRQLESKKRSGSYWDVVAVDSHAVFVVDSYRWRSNISIWRALISSFDRSKDKDIDVDVDYGYWEMLEMISLEEFDAILHGRKYSSLVQNHQFYCIGSRGIIFTAFLQPPILPVVWGNSGVKFDQAPHLVGLPDEALLMIGTIRQQDGSRLDVIRVSQKGTIII